MGGGEVGDGAAPVKLIGHAPAGHVEEPRFKGADRGVVFEGEDVFGDTHHGFLDDVLGFGFTQATFAGDAVDELPISVKKILPARLILPVL